jgi:hypothetical protein
VWRCSSKFRFKKKSYLRRTFVYVPSTSTGITKYLKNYCVRKPLVCLQCEVLAEAEEITEHRMYDNTERMPWTSEWILWQSAIRGDAASVNVLMHVSNSPFSFFFRAWPTLSQMIAFHCYPCASMWQWSEVEQVFIIHVLNSEMIKHPEPTHWIVSSLGSLGSSVFSCVNIRNRVVWLLLLHFEV